MALDFMAIISTGAYPTPTPTAAQRMAFAASYGLLDTLTEGVSVGGFLTRAFLLLRRRRRKH